MGQYKKGSNKRTALVLLGVVPAMVALTFASVPLYRLFCQVTGFGGTTQVAEELPDQALDRQITVRFNADVDPALPVVFEPVQRAVTLQVGEPGLAFYRVKNLSDQPVVTMATFNVTPLKVGGVFNKVQCFCFESQTLAAGQEVDMPVSFFVDPEIEADINLGEVKTITLSYTLFEDVDAADLSALPSDGPDSQVPDSPEPDTQVAKLGDLPAN
ncbi:MAG: cytochrome c oxidase assembly protein [Pseudomonadota bacterium]